MSGTFVIEPVPEQEIVAEIERRRAQLNGNLLKVYNYYRVFVGLALLLAFAQELLPSEFGRLDPRLFFWTCLGYALGNVLITVLAQLMPSRYYARTEVAFALCASDILTLTWLLYLSMGVSSGVGILILVAVACGTILVAERSGLLLAAIASIAVLYAELYLSLKLPDEVDFFQAGILGALYFAAALAIRSVSRRMRVNEIRSLAQAAELQDLERINQLIVQRMRTGIVLVNANNHVRMANQSARALLGRNVDAGQGEPFDLPNELTYHLDAWRDDPGLRARPFHVEASTIEVRANFSAVRVGETKGDVTIFLEDTSELNQQAQHLKLAALGRLSGSIAHEIRNPLGAISHASQLLKESHNLDKGDERLTDIIVSHCQRMNGVVENVLELSRRAPPQPKRINMQDWLTEFSATFREAVPEAELTVDVEPAHTEIRIDASQLSQALTNLVQNGARYSESHTGTASVTLRGGMNSRVERPFLDILDRGPGVPEEQRERLFEPFFTTEGTGTGLGLYLAQELCEANRAQLTYVPSQDGACFRITFSHPDRITG